MEVRGHEECRMDAHQEDATQHNRRAGLKAVLVAEDCERVLSRGDMVRVPFHVKRKFITRDVGVTLLALGATPGEAYRVPA